MTRAEAAAAHAHEVELAQDALTGALARQQELTLAAEAMAAAAAERAAHAEVQTKAMQLRLRDSELRLQREIEVSAKILARLEERERLLRGVFESTSWRLTAPLRVLRKASGSGRGPVSPPVPIARPVQIPQPKRPTLFVECTHTYHSDLNTGIQRVVRNVLRNAPVVAEGYGFDVVPVILDGDRFLLADAAHVLADKQHAPPRSTVPEAGSAVSLTPAQKIRRRLRAAMRPLWRGTLLVLAALLPFPSARRFLYAPVHSRGLARSLRLLLRPLVPMPPAMPASSEDGATSLDDFARVDGSILLLLDSSWGMPIWPGAARFKQRGGMIAGVIYDLIPITHSHTSVPNLVAAFKEWIANHLRLTDGFVCISGTIAGSLAEYIQTIEPDATRPSTPPISFFHLGSELDFITTERPVDLAVKDIFTPDRHVFLMVGSVEPRKMHAYVLDAFDRFWAAGGTAALVIVGRNGWKTEDFLQRVAEHPQLGRQLFILRSASDADLDHCYHNASSLVIASEIEGFGLPVVEAFQRGLPVMCSDIPVFREIADGRATFFGLSDPAELTQALDDFCRRVDLTLRRQRQPQHWIGWRESTEQLLAATMRIRQSLQG
jgi:alpha-1,2-rhamnosyltransferase